MGFDSKKILIHFLQLLILTNAFPSTPAPKQENNDQLCPNVRKINNCYFKLEDQINISGVPADMSIHFKTGNIFFTMISDQMKMHLEILHPNGEIEKILNLPATGQSSTVDNVNDIIYLASDNGIYMYVNGIPEFYSASGEDVMYVAAASDGTIYLATWPQNLVGKITKNGRKTETFPAIPHGHGLTIDAENNLYFVATKTSYILKYRQNIPIKINGLPTNKTTGVFVSEKGNVFAMDESSSFYFIDTENAAATFLGSFNISNVNTFAIDASDNVIIGVKDTIYKFNTYKMNPCKKRLNLVGTNQERKNNHHINKV